MVSVKDYGVSSGEEVTVIMAHYNGSNFIADQLDSISSQTHKNFKVLITDDKSDDINFTTMKKIAGKHENIKSVNQNKTNVGSAKSFLSGLGNPIIASPYYAFADQDDIWYENKLERALNVLRKIPPGTPALYCARTEIVDSTGQKRLGFSSLFSRATSFRNALVQNIGGGNTMVFNEAARKLIVQSAIGVDVQFHDWWTYIIVTGAGGFVYYDPSPCLKYRQHGKNVFGWNRSLGAQLRRARMLMRGDYRAWNGQNVKSLSQNPTVLTAENQQILRLFAETRNASFLIRLSKFVQAKLYRQTVIGNVGLFCAAVFKKI